MSYELRRLVGRVATVLDIGLATEAKQEWWEEQAGFLLEDISAITESPKRIRKYRQMEE